MTAYVDFWPDHDDKWRWHLIAGNHLIVADSGQGYATKSGARRAWRRFLEIAPTATEVTP